jgi:hypothetical protein
MILGYLLGFLDTCDDLRLSHLIVWLVFIYQNVWEFIVFRSTGTFDDLVKNWVSFVICAKNGFIE